MALTTGTRLGLYEILNILGAGAWRRTATAMVLQLGLVGAIVAGLLALPMLDVSVVDTLRGAGGNARPWLLDTPPLWFLGAYEWTLGADDPLLMRLAQNAVLALAASATLTALTYPMAYRRLMVSVVETGAAFGRTGWLAAAGEAVTRLSAARSLRQPARHVDDVDAVTGGVLNIE